METRVPEKLSSGKRTKEREEECDRKKINEDKMQPQSYGVRKGETHEGGCDTEEGEIKAGKGDQEKTEDDDDENPKKTRIMVGEVSRGYKNEFPGCFEGDQQRVKGVDMNTGGGDGRERKTGVHNAMTEVEEEEEEEALMEELLTAVGLGRWQVPLILTALISK